MKLKINNKVYDAGEEYTILGDGKKYELNIRDGDWELLLNRYDIELLEDLFNDFKDFESK